MALCILVYIERNVILIKMICKMYSDSFWAEMFPAAFSQLAQWDKQTHKQKEKKERDPHNA